MDLTFITGNENKYAEAKLIIPNLKRQAIDLPEIQELDPQKIIEHKLRQIQEMGIGSVIVEDTSLHINALNGLPGPLFKWFYKTLGNNGIYNLIESTENKSGKAVCMVGLLIDGKMKFFSAETTGTIIRPKGDRGFGWDPIFIADGQTKSTAEMSRKEKVKIHVRGMAFREVKRYISKLI